MTTVPENHLTMDLFLDILFCGLFVSGDTVSYFLITAVLLGTVLKPRSMVLCSVLRLSFYMGF